MHCRFKVIGLDCANCAAEIERAVYRMKEVEYVEINFFLQRMELELRVEEKEEALKKVRKVIKSIEPEVFIIEV